MKNTKPVLPVMLIALMTSCQSQRWLEAEAEYFRPSVRIYFDTGNDDEGELDVFKDGAISPAVDFLGLNFPYLVRKGVSDAAAEGVSEKARRDLATAKDSANRALERRDMAIRLEPMSTGKAETEAGGGRTTIEDDSATPQDLIASLGYDRAQLEGELDTAMRAVKEAEARVDEAEGAEGRSNGSRLDGDWTVGPRFAIGLTSPASNSADGSESSGAPVLFLSAGLAADFFHSASDTGADSSSVRLEVGYIFGISTDESLADADDGAVYVGMTVGL